MAYITSEEYKNKIYDEDTIQDIDILIDNTPINRDYIKNISYVDNVFENDSFSLGSTIISKYEIELSNEVYNDFPSFTEMTLMYKMELSDGYEDIPLGTYTIKEKDSTSEDYTKFKLYDYMDKFDVPFDASDIIPCTRFQLLQAMCTQFNIQLENLSIANGDKIVAVYDNSYTAKNYISFIAERSGGFAKINRNNKLEIKSFNAVDSIILPNDKAGDYVTNDLKTITKVIYQNATQMFEAGNDTGETIYLIQSSPFSCTQEEVNAIYNILNGIQFQTLDLKIWGDPSIDAGDSIILNDIHSFAQMNWTWGNGFYGSYKTLFNKASSPLNVEKMSSKTKVKKIESRIDEINGEILLITSNIDGLEENSSALDIKVDGIKSTVIATDEVVSSLNTRIQTAEQTLQSITNRGGNNILYNTALKDSNSDGYEYWTGNVAKSTQGKAVSGTSMLLQNSQLLQVVNVPNGGYVLSFTYKKLVQLSNGYVTINDIITENLNSTDYTEIEIPFSVTNGIIILKLNSDTDSAFEIYDLMLNIGSEKIVWSQNQNEFSTDTVTIGKSISVQSDVTNRKTSMDSTGLHGYNTDSDTEVFYQTDKGLGTDELFANKATIAGELIQKIGNQIWKSGVN